MDPYEAEARYVDTFDRGRQTSLHLFEHVHGDSRDRGPALIDLMQTYEKAGLFLGRTSCPTILAWCWSSPPPSRPTVARAFLGEMAHILNALFSALMRKASPYASVIGAVLEAAGEKAQAVAITPEPDMDEAWAEPEAFDGCAPRARTAPASRNPSRLFARHAPNPPKESHHDRLA
jgi:nitrate reductase delta subunit